MYHIKIQNNEGETTHKTNDEKKARSFLLDNIKKSELTSLKIEISEQA